VLLSSEKQMLADLVPEAASEDVRDFYKYVALAAFLAGGALGGVVFGALFFWGAFALSRWKHQ